MKNVFFYTLNILPEDEQRFNEYMENYGKPLMTKYCKNWELFELSHPLQGEGQPQYLGRFEIEDVTEFLSSEMPTEMKSALEKYGAIFKDGKQWIGQLIATNC